MRNLEDLEQFFSCSKLGFQLLSNTDSLWARVMSSKCNIHGLLLYFQALFPEVIVLSFGGL